MNIKGILIGGSVTALVIWVYQTLIVTYVAEFADEISSMLMGIPIVMGFVVYILADYLNRMFKNAV
jgi:uncharacterized membrane protein